MTHKTEILPTVTMYDDRDNEAVINATDESEWIERGWSRMTMKQRQNQAKAIADAAKAEEERLAKGKGKDK